MHRSCGKEVSEAMEDEQILDLFYERSEDAIEKVKEKYGPACMHLLRNLLFSEQDAEECTNDAYLALWNTIPPERPQPLLTYLLKIARNQGLRRITYNNAQRRSDCQSVAFEELESCLASGTTVEQALERKLLEEEVERFLRELPRQDRLLFLRRYWFCDGIDELAELFGYSKSKVKTKLFRLRGQLRQHLQQEGLFP